MNLFNKITKIELKRVIWALISIQIIMFLILVYVRESFENFHLTFESVHSKFASAISALPFWQASILIAFWITILLLLITIIGGYFYEARQRTLLKFSLNQAELIALKARVQPHFLFNTLNTIIYLINDNQDKAIATTRRLAELYRYILKASEAVSISLEEELNCVKQYLLIEKERFGDRLTFNIDLPEDWMKREVPGLILQPLIENCVLHGLTNSLENGRIEIFHEKNQDKESIVIKDNGVGIGERKLKNLLQSDRYGLKSVNERWLLFANNPLRLESKPGQGTCCYLDWE
ncbi:histidine kinase [bacterium]|nr:histidine kinase [bacterium]